MRANDTLLRDRSGVAALEGVAVVLMLVLLGLGALDVARAARLSAQAGRVAAETAALAARAPVLRDRMGLNLTRPDELGAVLETARQIAGAPAYGDAFSITLASVSWRDGAASVDWLRGQGRAAGAAAMTDGVTLPDGASAIVARAQIAFDPVLLDREALFGMVGYPRSFAARAVSRQIHGDLTTLAPPL